MTQRLSRHPWDPRSPHAPSELHGEFRHLMTCLTRNVALEPAPLFALYRSRTPSSSEHGGQLLRWIGFGKGVFLSTILLSLWAIGRPLFMLITKGSLLSIALKSAAGIGALILTDRFIRHRLRALIKKRPWVALGSMKEVDALEQAQQARFSPDLLALIEEVNADPGTLDTLLNDPRNQALKAPLNRLAVGRWDVLAELLSPGSLLPDAVLRAYDKAAVPLMRSAFELEESCATAEGRKEAIAMVKTRVGALVEKTEALLQAQASRRAHAQSTARAEQAAVADAIVDAISDMTGDHFQEGMAQLDALIESDRELGA